MASSRRFEGEWARSSGPGRAVVVPLLDEMVSEGFVTLEEPQGAELVDQCPVDGRLGREVVHGEPPGGGEPGEAFQAGLAADLDVVEEV